MKNLMQALICMCVSLLVAPPLVASPGMQDSRMISSTVIEKQFIESIGRYLEGRLLDIKSLEFKASIDTSFTELGLTRMSEDGTKERNIVQLLHYAADSTGRYLVDIDFLDTYSSINIGSKSVFDGEKLMRLIKGTSPVLAIRSGKDSSNVFITGFNPVLEGLAFLLPDLDSETNLNYMLDFPKIISSKTISGRMDEIVMGSISADSNSITFQIPGKGMLDGRRFDYEIVIALPMGLPSRVTRISEENQEPISIYEVLSWEEHQVSGRKIWLPIKVVEKIYDENGELLLSVLGEVSNYYVNREVLPDFFTIPMTEARYLHDENNEVTIGLKSEK